MFARILSAVALVAALLIPATAASAAKPPSAKAGKWAKRNHLHGSWRAKDPDHDGLSNLAEFKAGTNPRKADSDRDGLDDGDELRVGDDPLDGDSDGDGVKDGADHAGVVLSYGDDGTLTIKLFGGGTLSGLVNDTTEIECEDAHASDDGGGDDHGDDEGDDNGDRHDQGDDDDPGEDEDEHGDCDASALVAGATVKEAELKTVGGDAVFEEVELAP
jgi:hypothetical protein